MTDHHPAKKERRVTDPAVSFTERNIARWIGAFGVRSTVTAGNVERILERRNDRGEVVSRLRVSAIGYNGKMRLLSFEHKKMWNLIERLFDRQGKPEDNWVEMSSINFYDFLFDIASMDDPTRRKNRDGIKYRDMVYDLLMVLTLTPWSFEDWEIRGGSGVGVKRLNLIDEFEMYGRTDKGIGHGKGEYGKIKIKINKNIANGLRQRNTTPILIEIQNSIKSPNAGILYGYLAQVLFKMPVFEMDVFDLAERLQIGSDGHVIRDMKRAAKEIEGLDFVSGRIVECKIIQNGKKYKLRAVRAARDRRVLNAPVADNHRHTEEQRKRDRLVEDSEYLRRFDDLNDPEKEQCQKEITTLLHSWNARPGAMGYAFSVRCATIEIMEAYFTRKNDELVGAICGSEKTVLREPACLHPYKGAADIRHETATILNLLFPPMLKLPHHPKKSDLP